MKGEKTVETVGDFLIRRLREEGVGHVFGIPGDYVLKFYDRLSRSPIELINTCDELGAGYAADGYARVNGIGALCVTYGVGGLKVVNATAMAYAERSPMVVISGAPGVAERSGDLLLHHKVADFHTQLKVFQPVTVASTILEDPVSAAREINRMLSACLTHKRPVYIELPRDVESMPIQPAPASLPTPPVASDDALEEAMAEVLSMLSQSMRPMFLAGLELHRFRLQKKFLRLLEKTGVPFASTLMGKSVISEDHPQFVGIYSGSMCRPEIKDFVESSDCMLLFGAMLTDMNTGVWTAAINPARTVASTADNLRVRRHHYPGISLEQFLDGLLAAPIPKRAPGQWPSPLNTPPFEAKKDTPITNSRLFQAINSHITRDTLVVADIGDTLFGSADLVIHGGPEYLSCAYYTSVGFAIPCSVGAQMAAPQRKLLVLVGDGAFQMTGSELSTVVRNDLKPTVIVFNNRGFTTERPMLEGPFNDIHEWNYHKFPEVLGKGKGWLVNTEEEMAQALAGAAADPDQMHLIEVKLDPYDYSSALKRLTEGLGARV